MGRTAWREFELLLSRPVLLGLVVLLPFLMIALLTGIFRAGIPTGMAVAVVDLDRSDLSRSITRMLDAAPEVGRGARGGLAARRPRAGYDARRTPRDRDLL
jgi:hypothetical protein